MQTLRGKKIVLGVSGSIAAYKAAFLLRLLVKSGAEVQVVTSPAASQFVNDLTFSSLSGRKVFSGLWEENWSQHVAIGTWADLMIVAPATANTLAAFASGLCQNALQAVYLAARCPVMLAPAMDADMYLHPATAANLNKLATYGHTVLPVGTGYLASGLEGPGRMMEPEEILQRVEAYFQPGPLQGLEVLVTAGPTQEAIDPVRFISNHASGKMGFALAAHAARLGASVTLISGPVALSPPQGIRYVPVITAQEMYDAAFQHLPVRGVIIMSAAVADYRPEIAADSKIKKQSGSLELRLTKTKDILAALGQQKQPGQLLVGFALETDNELEHARDKLRRKNADLIVMNSLRDPGAGFGHDTNQVTLIDQTGEEIRLPLSSKAEIAAGIWQKIQQLRSQ